MASEAYKKMLVDAASNDVLYTSAIAGIPGNFLKPSISSIGMDPNNLPESKGRHQPNLPGGAMPWRDIWSAGQGVGLIKDVPYVQELVARIQAQYTQARKALLSTKNT